mmetsp:Transcript_8843/g.25239  ORF Transcript_8843/g.25239 Transcript_8843/m.25239 type:complete len:221 (+) Transcript_8843:4291-4953(+)
MELRSCTVPVIAFFVRFKTSRFRRLRKLFRLPSQPLSAKFNWVTQYETRARAGLVLPPSRDAKSSSSLHETSGPRVPLPRVHKGSRRVLPNCSVHCSRQTTPPRPHKSASVHSLAPPPSPSTAADELPLATRPLPFPPPRLRKSRTSCTSAVPPQSTPFRSAPISSVPWAATPNAAPAARVTRSATGKQSSTSLTRRPVSAAGAVVLVIIAPFFSRLPRA